MLAFQKKIIALQPGKNAFKPPSPWSGVIRQAHQNMAIEKLTERQLQVFILTGSGKTPREIAIILGITNKTVSNLKITVMDKMNLENDYQLIHFCVRGDMDNDDFMNRFIN